MTRTHFVLTAAMVLAFFLTTGGRVAAQEVRWRHDVAAARKEATETGRPLLLDFGTEACVWCRKLDATTFRDPKLVKLLNERFIPVKIDGNKEERLTQAMKIDGYPTLMLAASDGKVIDRHSGYLDAMQLTAMLNKAPAPAVQAPVASVSPTRPVAEAIATDAEKWRRAKEQIDADLAALHPKLAAALER